MPITVSELFRQTDIKVYGPVRWGAPVSCGQPGVYVVALSGDPEKPICLDKPPLSDASISEWINRVPNMIISGTTPTVESISARIRRFWLPNETVIYIGSTNRALKDRVGEFYKHKLGFGAPHCGGHWLKTLLNISDLYVFWSAIVADPEGKEGKLLSEFHNSAINVHATIQPNEVIMPFANLQAPAIDTKRKCYRKKHGVSSPTL